MTQGNVRTVKLNDGSQIPVIAFGTGTAQAWTDSAPVVASALEAGYRHLDCAWHYKNQHHTGRAIKESGLKREDVWVTSKAGSFDDDPADFDARKFLESCLKDLGVEYVDMYLIHADILVGSVKEAWKQMEQIKKDGLARSIGVSNFTTDSLAEILADCEVPPAINQIEFHPYSIAHYLPTLLPLCKKHDIKIAAYGPLMSIVRHKDGPVDDVVKRIAQERGLGETEGQVLLRWNQEITGGIVVTTSSKTERMTEQIQPFLIDSPAPPLSVEHRRAITQAGTSAPFRFWGQGFPYFMKGEGNFLVCHPDATHRNKNPNVNGGRGW
ncbi:hypothetical protein L198_02974 [Cryptococcus wingfieldii CBS 7118]|uniref:NADP-dependent oxidoreductase domain-containing protein n=1 Tax=Cryptococcus wingfieldii CBS 7118 TaxID=1295528 RepID=A0A1E3JL44_9TREE|nr:hypothetical protein L198_02974 [Cryptococcus wingfieldii CBS 7118]ODO00652.1 hypothetical protein L198_02974 [Cryptococcus wingfieldii CBS 7118]